MKNLILSLIVTICISGLFSTGTSASQSAGGHEIKVRLKGLKDTICYLAYNYGDQKYYKDTVQVNSEGWAVFKGNEPLPGGIYLVVLPDKKSFFEFLVTEQNFTLETDTSDLLGHIKVNGSKENELFFYYQDFLKKQHEKAIPVRDAMTKLKDDPTKKDSLEQLRDQLIKMGDEVVAFQKKVIGENPGTLTSTIVKMLVEIEIPPAPDTTERYKYWGWEYRKKHFWDNVDFQDERVVRTPFFHNKLIEYIEQMTVQHPDSIIKSVDVIVPKTIGNDELFQYTVQKLLNKYATSKIMCMDAVYVHTALKYYTKELATWLDEADLTRIRQEALLNKPTLCNKKAPGLNLKNPQGEHRSLYEVNSKYTIVVFWDPDCGHCKKVIPKLKTYYDSVKAKGVEVYSVCVEQEYDKWVEFLKKHDLNWINVADMEGKSNYRSYYYFKATPHVILLNEKKEVIAKRLGVEQLQEFLDKMLEKDAKSTKG